MYISGLHTLDHDVHATRSHAASRAGHVRVTPRMTDSASGPAVPGTSAPMQQVMPRMTDSATGPGGPTSLKFASLSVESYRLDSPPFTGTAVGSAELSQTPAAAAVPQRQSPLSKGVRIASPANREGGPSSSDIESTTPSQNDVDYFGNIRKELSDANRRMRSRDESRDSAVSHDSDVPDWRLDQRSSRRSPTKAAPDTVRPAFSCLAESLDGIEDATSVVDDEVDGDGPPFVLRRTASNTARVPIQGQTKVRLCRIVLEITAADRAST